MCNVLLFPDQKNMIQQKFKNLLKIVVFRFTTFILTSKFPDHILININESNNKYELRFNDSNVEILKMYKFFRHVKQIKFHY